MADKITATKGESKFKPHPTGTYLMVCVDVIDLGRKVVDFKDKDPYLAPACVLVFASGERNDDKSLITVSKEFTVSTSPRSALRKCAEAWRGKPWTDEEIEAGIPIDKMEGKPVLLGISHRVSAKNRTYADITSFAPPMKGQKFEEDISDYKRGDYWNDRKKEYEKAVYEFEAASGFSHEPETEESTGAAPPDDTPFHPDWK